MDYKNIMVSRNARIVYLAVLVFLSSLFFKQIGKSNSLLWYAAIALNLILLLATARWIRKADR